MSKQFVLHIVFSCCFILLSYAQNQNLNLAVTSAESRWKGYEQRKKQQQNSIVANIPFRAIGPSIQSCRVTDIDVNPEDPSIFYVAYASGGLWKTENNGTTFKPIFDNEMVMTIGDIAVDWKNNIIWVGTGEANSSRSSYAGAGIFKSKNEGKTWEYVGLGESHHIGRIILHPSNPEIAYAAVLGHLYTPNKERGVFKTTDGGKTWIKSLFVDENTGAIDMMIDPQNPDNIFVAMWHRERSAWNFVESGKTSGIYMSNNGGANWNKISTPESGFPQGNGNGRIGLSIYQNEGKTTLYAILDNQAEKPESDRKKDEDEGSLTKQQLKKMTKEQFLKIDEDKLNDFLKDNDFPETASAKEILSKVKEGKMSVNTLIEYLEDANTRMMETEIKGAELYRSDDFGKIWTKTHDKYLDDLFYTYGYYFGTVVVSPHNPNTIYLLGMPLVRSTDGGKTFQYIGKDNVHADHHSLWINPKRNGHIINGNDGGINISYDGGENWIKCNNPPVGQIYQLTVDNASPYNVYAGFQDNGVWVGPSTAKPDNVEWLQEGQYPFKMIMGGDGMQTQVDTRDNKTVYTGWQFGNYYRINTATNESKSITPKHELGERPHRWNWQTPIHLSTHNQDIIYMGANKVFRSMTKGDKFETLSDDLTNGGKAGDVPFGTLTCLHESPMKFGLLYSGSDDGKIHVSKDGGIVWTNINFGLPENLYVSRIQASNHSKSRVYVSFNGYRSDDFAAYLYVSESYGGSWKKIGNNLPAEPINVVKEDPKNENVIYVGTDHGVYVSFDKGQTFHAFVKDLPAVAVHDLVIHPKEGDLLLGTHGRSVLIASAKEIQATTPEILAAALHLFEIKKEKARNWGYSWNKMIKPEVPTMYIPLYSNIGGKVKVKIYSDKDLLINALEMDITKGFNYVPYHYTLLESSVAAYEKALNEDSIEKDKKAKPIKIKKADDGNYYIKAGSFKINVELGDKKIDGKFELSH
jgi:photosystem II stability/assembly factor-like uncharacterized protein